MTETKKTSYMGQVIRLALILFVVAAITAGILGAVNAVTYERIAEQNAATTAAAYAAVLPTEQEYIAVEGDFSSDITAFYLAEGDGYVVELYVSGSQDMITLAVGIDLDGVVTGVSIIDHSETAGLGAKATEESWRSQYIGVSGAAVLDKDGGDIAAITGATNTSRAVTNAVNTALDAVAGL